MTRSASPTESDLTGKTLLAIRWIYVSIVLQAVLQLTILAVLSRLLSPHEFGVLGIALIFTNFVERVGFLGIGPSLVQRTSVTERHIAAAASISLFLGLAALGVMIAGAPLVARFFNEPSLVPVLQTLSLMFLLESLATVSDSLLQRELRFKALLLTSNVAYAVGTGIIGIGMAYAGFGVWALVWASIATRALRLIALSIVKPVRLTIVAPRAEARELLRSGVGFSLGRLLSFFALNGDNFIVGRVLGTAALGMYSRAYQLMVLPATYFGQVLEKALFPAMSRKQQESAPLGKVFLWGIECAAIVGLATGVFMYVCAREIVLVLFGGQWLEVVPTLQILSLGMFFRLAYKNSDTLVRSLGAVYRHSARQLVYTLLVLAGSLLGSRYGLPGVAWAVLAAVAANYLLLSQLGLGLLNIPAKSFLRAHLGGIWVAAGLTCIVAPTVWWLRSIGLMPIAILTAAGILSALVMIGALFLMPNPIRPSSFAWAMQRLRPERFGRIGRLAGSLLAPRRVGDSALPTGSG